MLLGGAWIWEWREGSGARLAAPPDHRPSLLEIEVALLCCRVQRGRRRSLPSLDVKATTSFEAG